MDLNKNTLPGVITFIVVMSVFWYILSESGAMKDVTAGKFDKAIVDVTAFISGDVKQTEKLSKNNAQVKNIKNNMFQMIVPNDMYTTDKVNIFKDLFTSKKKVVFYVYTPAEIENAEKIKKFIETKYSGTFVDLSMEKDYYLSRKANAPIRSSGCSSIDECRKMQKNSAKYAAITTFVDNCTKGVCIIDNTKRHYVKVSSKDADTVIKVLKKYASE